MSKFFFMLKSHHIYNIQKDLNIQHQVHLKSLWWLSFYFEIRLK